MRTRQARHGHLALKVRNLRSWYRFDVIHRLYEVLLIIMMFVGCHFNGVFCLGMQLLVILDELDHDHIFPC